MASRIFSLLLLGTLGLSAWGQQAQGPPPGDEKPFPRTEADGPTSFVTAAALSPDGRTLYVAAWDKVVHVWRLNAQGKFELDRNATFRVPIGPGMEGSLNALALSPDGQWLAVAGQSLPRGGMTYRTYGFVLKRIPVEVLRDRGTIHVFNTKTRAVKQLRGHVGQVVSLAFASNGLLTSAGQEWDGDNDQETSSVRTWDVDKGTNLTTLRDLPKASVRPGLAAWTTAGGPRVAMAWDDEKLRVWDPGQPVRIAKDGKYNAAVAYLAERDLVLSTSFSEQKGWLKGWKLGGAVPEADKAVQAAFMEADGTFFVPRALTLFAGKANGPIDHAAVVLRTAFVKGKERPEEDRLQIVRIGVTGNLKTVLTTPIVVAKGGGTQPVLAASAGGRHLIVAGNRNHEVLVYAIDDLLKVGAKIEPQRLRSNAETIYYAAFVKKGKERGLVLNPQSKKAPGAVKGGDLLFDFSKRKLSADSKDWQLDAPAAGGWSVEFKDGDVFISQGNKPISKIDLKNKQVVTDHAILPGTPPLLALASDLQHQQQELALYDMQTGQQVQRLIGHTGPIHSLAFAGDGKLLVSAAEDQTVCVWTLADFDKVMNRNGSIDGLNLRDDNKTVVLDEIEASSQAQGKLKVGDVIEGIVEDGKLKPVTSAAEFYQAIWLIKPKTAATIRVRNRADIEVVVGQGVETRNPLFCMLITRGVPRDWLVWSPTGPYDASRAEVERNLGWHFNTGKPEAPTRFAEVGQYKKDNYRPDLIQFLVSKGKLDTALEEWERDLKEKARRKALPEPRIDLRLAEAEPVRRDGEVIVRQAPKTLRLAIDNFAADDVGAVTWNIAGLSAEPKSFASGVGREYTADLSTLPWKRGAWKVRVEVQTREDSPRKYTQELPIRYQPLPPEVTVTTGRQVVEKAGIQFKAEVKGVAGQAIRARLIQRHQGKEVVTDVPAGAIDKALTLGLGTNLIEVVATNRDAPAGMEELETTRQVVELTFQPPVPDPQPILTLESIQPKNGRSAALVPIVPGRPLVVDADKVIVRGKIAAGKNLSKAAWGKVGAAPQPMTKFQGDKAKEFAFAEELTLVPGTQQFRFSAQTEKSDTAETTLSLDFRPPLPQLVLTTPQPGLIHYEGRDQAEVEVGFQVIGFQPAYPFQATVLVNDQPAKVQPALAGDTLTAKVPLTHGDNRIQVRLRNKWGVEEAAEDTVVVRYLKPPRVTQLDGPAESEQSLVNLTATVESALPLLPGSVDAEVSNAATGTRRRISTYEVAKGEPAWTVRLKDVPLEVGSNEVRLFVSNSDARSLKEATRTIVYKKTPPPPAVVELIDPKENLSLTERELTMSFKVTSKSPLRRLELVQLTPVSARQSIDVSKLIPAGKDEVREIKLKLKLTGSGQLAAIVPGQLNADSQGFLESAAGIGLASGTNTLRVEAVNDGGQTDASVVVNLVRRPAELVLDRLQPRGGKGSPIPAEADATGKVFFRAVDQGRVMLQGRVRWDVEKDDQLKQVNSVQVYVNGLRQPPVPLDPPVGNVRERVFQAPLSLTGTNNTVEVDLPDVVVDRSVRNRATVECLKPEAQRLHLLIVGVGEENEQDLTNRVLQALHANNVNLEQRRFSVPNFSEARLYPPLVGYVRPGQVLTELRRIKDEVDLLSRAGSTSDVVMVYFAGQKSQEGSENYCLTSVSKHVTDLRRSALAFSSLEACLKDTLGAQVMLMDVTQSGKPQEGAGGAGNYLLDSRVGLVCYEWGNKPVGTSGQLTYALDQAMQKSRTLGQVANELQDYAAKQQTLTCHHNIIRGHQLTVMPIGANKKP